MARKPPRSPEEIEQMRCEAETMSYAEVGRLHGGISRERVRQLVGNANRSRPPGWKHPCFGGVERSRQKVAELFKAGKTDAEIATVTGLRKSTVEGYRSRQKLRRNLKLSEEHSLWCLAKWIELFGYVPAANDWNPPAARALGHERRAVRFVQFRARFGCPYSGEIVARLYPWGQFIENGGHPRPRIGARQVPWREAPLLSEMEEPQD